MRHIPGLILVSVLGLALAGCVTRPPVPNSAAEAETLKPEEDLVGNLKAEGTFTPRFGGNTRGVTADLTGTWDGQTLTLREEFLYSDGEEDVKTWQLTKVAPGEWTGTREDVVGTARGYEDGDAFRLEYNVKLDGRTVGFRDVLVERSDGSIYNIANIGYYGLKVGEIELVIRPME